MSDFNSQWYNEYLRKQNRNKDSRQPAKLEQGKPNEPLAANVPEKRNTGAGFMLITDVRKRLLDDDNLCEKFHVDGLRYSHILSNDSAKQYRIFTTQRKCGKQEEPHILVEIFESL